MFADFRPIPCTCVLLATSSGSMASASPVTSSASTASTLLILLFPVLLALTGLLILAFRYYHQCVALKAINNFLHGAAEGPLPAVLLKPPSTGQTAALAHNINNLLAQHRSTQQQKEEALAQQRLLLQQARHQALQTSALQNEFLANMSHELRTPMNGILGIATLLEKTALEPGQQEYLQIIRRSAQSLLIVQNDILDVATLRAGKVILQPVPLRLASLVENILQPLSNSPQAQQLQLSSQLTSAVPEWVVMDPRRLKQLLLKLLGNAIKFTERGSVSLHITASAVTDQHCELIISVSDTGIGIDAHQQQRIFEAFAQADTGSTRRYAGTGVGLSIVAQLVELMHGTLTLQSEPGAGSTFTVRLPVTVASAPPGSHTELWQRRDIECDSAEAINGEAKLAAVPLSILVAEDNPANQHLIHELLQARGHRLTLVENGLAAVTAFQTGHYDQILMDIQMPVMDGLEATRKIRELDAKNGHSIPIIALTAHARRGDDERCLAAGMSHYLSKPVDPALLIRKIEGQMLEEMPAHPVLTTSANEDHGSVAMLLDKERLHNITRSNPSLIRSIAKLFLDELPVMQAAVEQAQADGDATALAQAVHRLKSAVGNFAVPQYYREIAELESLAHRANSPEWQRAWARSAEGLQQLSTELNNMAGW